uniref:Reverse transcriptase domain-containing protein n=1 Tax=Daphnia galeata TaxID=27404 RepID=A0A8J2RLW8_9CRUS|nr:unnamed protein product [Daphnia galeata]
MPQIEGTLTCLWKRSAALDFRNCHSIIIKFTNLQMLDISRSTTADSLLYILGTCFCPSLKELYIDHSLVSDAGINGLCVIGKCSRSIRILSLWDSNVTSVGIKLALTNIPTLDVLLHDSVVATLSHLHQTAEIGDSTKFNLSTLALRINSPFEDRNLSDSVFLCPSLQNVELEASDRFVDDSLLEMLIARKISNLSIDGTRTIEFIFSRSVHTLLSSIGHSLHRLTVQNVEDVSLSLSTGAFPSSLKHGIITPLLKKPTLDWNVLSNFLPVSNLSFLSKLIERAVLMLLTEHLSKFSLLPVHQSAYRANHSTGTALLYLFDDLLTTADQKDVSALVLLDLSAAFDTIDHQILLERLSHCFGLSGTAVNWFLSYLSNRTQSVQVRAYTSAVVHILFGVAQGSVLGGPLFIMYVTPFAGATTTEGVQSQCRTRLGWWFEKTNAWLTINRVQLNIPKSTLIYTYNPGKGSTSRHIDSAPLQIGSLLVRPSTTACNLGVIIDTHLTIEAQVMKTCRAANFHLSRIKKIRRFLDFSSVKCVVNALRLLRVQNAAVRTIFNLRKRDHLFIHRQSLRWLEIADRAKLKVACLAFRCLNGSAPPYLSDLISCNVPGRELRSADKNLLICKPFRLILFGK